MVSKIQSQLAEYGRKRDFSKTLEPNVSEGRANRQLVIQQHFAKRLHYDLRLEIDGVLVSWAVTRGPSANPKDKRLAVRTEDHPIDYGSFEGTIAKGQYGGGTVVLWESSTYNPLNGDPGEALAKGEIKFESQGSRLRGKWVLVRMKTAERNENWLLIKERDEFVEEDDSLAHRFTTGITSRRTPAEIEAGKLPKQNKTRVTNSVKSPPLFIAPQLCGTSDIVPSGNEWAFELKYDGYRLILSVRNGECVAFTRSGLDWSNKFPAIVRAASALPCKSAIIDTEAVILDSRGMSDFPALVSALESQNNANIIGIAFDLLHLDGDDVRSKPYLERKQLLKTLLKHPAALRFGDHLFGSGEDMLRQVSEAGGEGIIAKDISAPYRSGRQGSWVKIKTNMRIDVDVIGYMPSQKGERFASLLAAKNNDNGAAYVGRIGTGYNAKVRASLAPLLNTIRNSKPTVSMSSKLPRGAIFIQDPFNAEVRVGGWTTDGQMRQARFISLQNDRIPLTANISERPSKVSKVKASTATWRITHPDRETFPQSKITKGDIAEYYRKIWPRIAPHLANRPVSLLRVPETIEDETFFQRHPLKGMTKGLHLFGAPQEEYFALEGEDGLATAIQFGTVEIHGWNATLPELNYPDRMIFDLDPDETLSFSEVKSAAITIKDYLEAAKFESWPLLSGGKGIHILVPLNRTNPTAEVEFFCSAFAKAIAQDRPNVFVSTISKAKRAGKILIDYLRNRQKATAIVPWSMRARPGAPIAAPVSWTTLENFQSPKEFNVLNIPLDDPWDRFWNIDQRILPEVLKTLKFPEE